MESDKTPGEDGLTKEFYATYWGIIKEYLIQLFSNAYLLGGTCESWNLGTTTIIYKKVRTKKLSNWRPITRLNSDYKILAGILANRLKRILPRLILSTQKCAIKNRNITDILRNIHAVTEYLKERRREALIVNLDQQKAFDMINQEYLIKILNSYGLPTHFVKIIKNIYNAAKTQVIVNSAMTNQIHLEREIRQGCPLSMALYAISCGPLARKIQRDREIKGINIGRMNIKIQQYADDMTCVLQTEKDVEKVFEKFEKYKNATGQELNETKSEILYITSKRNKQLQNTKLENSRRKQIRIIGQLYGENYDVDTWTEKVAKIQCVTQACKERRMTWMGKTTI